MQQILIPTDFSDNALNALKYGLALFKKSRCTFHLVHIDPIPPYSGAGSAVRSASLNFEDYVLEESRERLKEWMSKIEKLPLNTKHTFVTLAIHDFFVDAIKRESENRKIDLILMGTKGASGLKKATIGSNTADVITKIKCPLLAVPEDAEYRPLREIAFPTDYHTGYDGQVLDRLVSLVQVHRAALRILHISKKGVELSVAQQDNQNFLNDYLKDVEHSFHSLTGKQLEAAVQCFTESRDIDMIAMVAKNLNFFQRILFKPAVEEISYHTKVPFLVLHE